MKRLLPLLVIYILMLENAGVSQADDFHKGVEAYNKSDYVTALREWLPLGERGDADVQYSLGVMHDLGQGVRQDYMTAVKWYSLAAEQGQPNAQAALGQMHQNGDGLPKDLIRGYMLYIISAAAGVKRMKPETLSSGNFLHLKLKKPAGLSLTVSGRNLKIADLQSRN